MNNNSTVSAMKIDPHVYTAFPIAAARAVAFGNPNSMIKDPLASRLLAGQNHLLRGGAANEEYMTMRALLGDELVTAQHQHHGVRQVVFLGAGMDSRAFRLDLPGTVFFEVDKANLFEIKDPLLTGIPLTCAERKTVKGTLGEMDLGKSLTEAGFDKSKPTTWLMEGLLPYFTGPVMRNVAKSIGELSAPGSALWGDGFSKTSVDSGNMIFHGVPFESGFDDYDEVFREAGFDDAQVVDFSGIWLDRKARKVRVDERFVLTPERTRGRRVCLMVRASKSLN